MPSLAQSVYVVVIELGAMTTTPLPNQIHFHVLAIVAHPSAMARSHRLAIGGL